MPRPMAHRARSRGRSLHEPQGWPLSTRRHRGRPHCAKVRRRTSWTKWGETCCHCSWGGKLGRQDGPRGLVGDGQPTGQPAVGQALLLHGVHLPDVVGPAPPAWPPGLGPPRGAIDAGPAEPALEGPLRGHQPVRPAPLQDQADQDGAPGRVESLQPAGGPDHPRIAPRPEPTASAIGGAQSRLARIAIAAPELAHGAIRQPEVECDSTEGLALLMALNDDLTDR
jgi:hypothetical protein